MNNKLFANILTAPMDDPKAMITFERGSLAGRYYGKQRVGRPRLRWAKSSMEDFWYTAVETSSRTQVYYPT